MLAFFKHRKVILGMMIASGLVLLSQEYQAAGFLFGLATGFWLLAGRPNLIGPDRRKVKPEPVYARAASPSNHGVNSDGVGGSFNRLHPAWQSWLNAEVTPSNQVSDDR